MSMSNVRPSNRMVEAETVSARPAPTLVGTWRLLSWEAGAADGSVTLPFGDRPAGYTVYTTDGHLFGQLMRRDRPDFAGGDLLGGTPEENAMAIRGYIAYGGTYEIQEGTVVHHVEVSLFPNWIDGDQRRIVEWDEDRLILSTPPMLTGGSALIHRLTWERVLPSQSPD